MKRVQFRRLQINTPWLMRLTIIALCGGGVALIFAGYRFQWAWTGFNKTLWDWMQLLIVPTVLALAAIWFNRIGSKREQTLAHDSQQEAALQAYLDRMHEFYLGVKVANVLHTAKSLLGMFCPIRHSCALK